MRPRDYDVIIAGAGPAGSSAAAILGKAGKRVLLIDKGKFPRDKTCGDGLTYKYLPLLEKLGVARDFHEQAFFRSAGYSISFAIESGMIAGETALDALAADNFSKVFLQQNDARWQASFGERFSKAGFVQETMQKSQLVEYFSNAVANHPAFDAAMQDQGSQYEWMFKLKALVKAL